MHQAKATVEVSNVLEKAASHANTLRDAADQLYHQHNDPFLIRAPAHDVPTALDVLQTGRHLDMAFLSRCALHSYLQPNVGTSSSVPWHEPCEPAGIMERGLSGFDACSCPGGYNLLPSVIETLRSEPEASPGKRTAAVQLMDQLLRARLLQVTVRTLAPPLHPLPSRIS